MTFWDRRVLHVLNCFVRSENSLLRGIYSSDRHSLKILKNEGKTTTTKKAWRMKNLSTRYLGLFVCCCYYCFDLFLRVGWFYGFLLLLLFLLLFVVVVVVVVVVFLLMLLLFCCCFSVGFVVGLGLVYNSDSSSGHFYSTVFYPQG